MKAKAQAKLLGYQSNYQPMSILFLMFLSLLFLSTAAKASYQKTCGHRYYYCGMTVNIPMAICTTGGTNIPLPRYVCCQLLDKKGHQIWGNTWVAGSCRNAHPYAMFDLGCRKNSPVYNTGKPILGTCQFSHITGKCW